MRAVKMTAEATKVDLATKCAPTVKIYFQGVTPVLNFAESSRKFVSGGRGAASLYVSVSVGPLVRQFRAEPRFLRCVPWSNCFQWRR